jgi:ATP-dependent exoDNAse (exonuclease V) beta subunit
MNIDVISASAGSGKTWNLEKRAREAIEEGSARPEAIVGITYTKKAAAELTRRLRRGLLQSDQSLAAGRIRDGYLGTVHSVCQRIIADLAFESGSSPYPEPAPEAYSKRLFRETVGTITRPSLDELNPLARVLGLQPDDSRTPSRFTASTWRDALQGLVEEAHENRMSPAVLQYSLEQSLLEVTALLDAAAGVAADRDTALFRDLPALHTFVSNAAEAEVLQKGKASDTANRRMRWTREQTRLLGRGDTPPWAKLVGANSSPFTTKALEPVLQGLRAQLDIHLSHPRLHDELARILALVFGHAAAVGQAFVDRKKAERLLDFEDMLAQAADVLVRPVAQEHLGGQIDLLLVDEFQDTSPVQLQVVFALAGIAKRTIWVGDRKQSIFGFQGSDPALMESATAAVLNGASPEVLDRNFRSRPGLVRFCSAVFTKGLEPYGFDPREVGLEPACPESPAHEGTHSLHLWAVGKDPNQPKGRPKEAKGIAAHIHRHLGANTWLVREHLEDPTRVAPTRPAGAGDIAVLARTNDECRAVSAALKAFGIASRVAQDELGSTPEAKLLRAGLAMLADPEDCLAAAEVAWFSGSVDDPDAWLSARIELVNARDPSVYKRAFDDIPAVAAVRAVAGRAGRWSPEEAVLAVMDALDLPERVLSWPDPRGHLANLEALRAVASGYQDTCAARRSAATVAGLVHHFDGLPGDTPQAIPATDDAVRVLTYYKAKGLEWPIVVCANLDKAFSTKLFDVRVEPADTFNPDDPLDGRSLRWWPWPYGGKSANLELSARAAETGVGARRDLMRRAENSRLLYVGFTRARDHLCLVGMGKTRWLDELVDVQENKVLDPPWESPGDQVMAVGGQDWRCRVSFEAGLSPETATELAHEARWFVRPEVRTARKGQPIRPSSALLDAAAEKQVQIAEVVTLGERQKTRVKRGQMNLVGDAIHNFFAADPRGEMAPRESLAKRMIHSSALAGQIEATTIVNMADRFDGWLKGHSQGARLPEWPVRWRREDGRAMAGDIDLLVDLGEGWLLLDHKSFPGDTTMRDERLRKWAGQLAAYRGAVERATGRPVLECWVHLPVRSEVVRLVVPRG